MADIGEIRARLILQNNDFNQKMADSRKELDKTSQSAENASESIDQIHTASLAFAAAVTAVFTASTMVAANFEQKMQDVKAVSGASQEELQQLSELAKEMGEQTAFSASEAAGGIEELIKAGLSVEQIINGGLHSALNLAIAGNLQLAEAAEIASTALNAFKDDNLTVEQAANILAGAANASATDVRELKYGLSQVSAVAAGVGLSFEDTSIALAAFAQNGLKGSDAGTSLKTMLMNLQPTTKEQIALFKELGFLAADGSNAFYDMNGQLKGIEDIAGTLRNSMKDMTDQQRSFTLEMIFGSDAVRAGNILYKEGADGLNNMWDAMSKVTAADVAATKMDSLKGSFTELQSSLESAGIELGEEFLPMLTQLVRMGTDAIRSIDEMDMANIKAALAFGGTAAAIALVGSSLVQLAAGARLLFASMGPAGWIITGLSILTGVIAGAVVQSKALNEVTLDNANAMIDQHSALQSNIQEYDLLKAKSKLTNDELARFLDINSELSKTVDPNVIKALKDEQAQLQEKSGLTNEELSRLVQLNSDIIEVVPESTTKITDQGNALLVSTDAAKQYNEEQLEMIRLELEHQKAKAESKLNENLADEKRLIREINDLNSKKIELTEQIREKESLVLKATSEINKAKETGNEAAQEFWEMELFNAQQELQILKDSNAELAGKVLKRQESLDKVREEIKKLDEVHRKMIDIEMRQVGLTTKRGEELAVIDQEIVKLEFQKRKLEEQTPIAQRNTDEYRRAASAIQTKIDKLNSTKDRINEIISRAGVMNSELGKSIYKSVIVRSTGSGNDVRALPSYHSGGVVDPPILHTGGRAAQFLSHPMHNEVDVRLLREEMVLTEAQQANLFKLFQMGSTNRTNKEVKTEIYQPIVYMTVEGNIDQDLYEDIMDRQYIEIKQNRTKKGLKT